jgi:uncharacterized cupin superfamily protein
MVMSPVLMRIDDESAFSAYTPVGTPTSTTVAQVRTAETVQIPEGSSGIWECTPGCFRRGVVQAEFSYFIEGSGCFRGDDGTTVEFRAGDTIYFAANTKGEWDIRQTVRKAYVIFG